MPRTWSNTKVPHDPRSAAQRARQRPSGLSVFLVMMVLMSLFFMGLTIYAAYQAERHPVTETTRPADPGDAR